MNLNSPAVVSPIILSQDPELQELFLKLVNRQVLEISATKADGAVIFEQSQGLISQRVNSRDCSAEARRDAVPLRRYYLQSASSASKGLIAPIFSYAPPALEKLYGGFEDIISRGRTENKSDADILTGINTEIEDIKQTSPDLSADQIAEISAGCRTLSDAYKHARDEERRLSHALTATIMGAFMNSDPIARELARQHAMDTIRKDNERRDSLREIKKRELKLLSKRPLKKPCQSAPGLEQAHPQVFLIDHAATTTFVVDLPLQSIASIHSVQARVILETASQ